MTITIIYSFNKRGFELDFWQREIAGASTDACRFIPFNHGAFLGPQHYGRAQLLDNLWFAKDRRLIAIYDALEREIEREKAVAVVVDNANPYHPEFLRTLGIHKVMRTSDGPTIAYDRDIPYVHAFDQILYHSRAYSPELTMPEKLDYVGAKRADFWPLALFDAGWESAASEDEIVSGPRDIDVLFVGALHLDKMPLLAKVKKAFGRRCRLHGLASLKKNVFFKAKYRTPGWVTPITFENYLPLYRRAKVGFNVHLRGDYTVGGYRLFELPANGVMQISDGGPYLEDFYAVGSEIQGYRSAEELISKIDHFLTHDREREAHVRAAFRRTMQDHRIGHRMGQLGALVADGMAGRTRA
jgi:hypothetical protein